MADETNQPTIVQQPVVAPENKTQVVFGAEGLTLMTPDKVKAIFSIITFFIGIIALAATSFRAIPDDVQKEILEYTVFAGIVLQKAEGLWGIKVTTPQ